MEDFTVIEFEIDLASYQLEAFGIDNLTEIFCTLFVDTEYVMMTDDVVELIPKEAKPLQRHLDRQIIKTIHTIENKNLRPLVFLDEIIQTIEKELLLYSEKHPFIQVVEISIDTVATTYSNPLLIETLDEFYDEAKLDFMEMMNMTSDEEFEDFFIDNLSLLDSKEDDFDNYEDVFDEEDDDDTPGNGDNVLKFPFGRRPF